MVLENKRENDASILEPAWYLTDLGDGAKSEVIELEQDS